MVSERSDSEDVDEAVEDPVEDEMEERWAATADLDDDEDGGEAFENTSLGRVLLRRGTFWRRRHRRWSGTVRSCRHRRR